MAKEIIGIVMLITLKVACWEGLLYNIAQLFCVQYFVKYFNS